MKELEDFKANNRIKEFKEFASMEVGQEVTRVTATSHIDYKFIGMHPLYSKDYIMLMKTSSVVKIEVVYKSYIEGDNANDNTRYYKTNNFLDYLLCEKIMTEMFNSRRIDSDIDEAIQKEIEKMKKEA